MIVFNVIRLIMACSTNEANGTNEGELSMKLRQE